MAVVKFTDDNRERELRVVVEENGDILYGGPIKLVHDWLIKHGYKNILGSNGQWIKENKKALFRRVAS